MELAEGDWSQQLAGDPHDPQGPVALQSFELAGQKRGRRTAMLCPWVPRPTCELRRPVGIATTLEDGFGHHWQAICSQRWEFCAISSRSAASFGRSGQWPAGYTGPMSTNGHISRDESTFTVKAGLAEMLKGGVIMDVVTPEQAKLAEDAGAAAVMALERVPADIRRDGGVARMSDPEMIKGIQEAVTIPVMAKARIGHFAEAQVLEALEVDYIDESEVLTPADTVNHIDKWAFKAPFVCGATNLGEALRRIGEGAAMIRSKGEAGTGDIVNAVTHLRQIRGELRRLTTLGPEELAAAAKELQSPLPLVRQVAAEGKLPVVLFCAGGIATPADASLVMQLGAEGVFVGSGIFKSSDPERRARAIVEATTHYADAARVAAASTGLGAAMESIETSKLESEQLLSPRGW
jgi:pyridoxal 5'-phosphate synthase pdxS subunit